MLVRAIRRRFQRHGLVLVYHRIAVPLGPDPWSMCVSSENFAQHLDVLLRYTDVVPLQQLTTHPQASPRSRPRVALTFDDGYADNVETALPILRRKGVPATFFLPTSLIGKTEPFWWDLLSQIVMTSVLAPREMLARLLGLFPEWASDLEAPVNASAGALSRTKLLHLIWARLRGFDHPTRHSALPALCDALDWKGGASAFGRAMTREEVQQAHASGLIEIGAHSATHADLSIAPPDARYDEILEPRRWIEQLIGGPPASFSYPYGYYSPETPDLVARAGYSIALTNRASLAWFGDDPMLVPRFAVRELDGVEFRRRLQWLWLP